VTRRVIDTPATTREVAVPALYETVDSTVQVSEAKSEWRSILCETNATPVKVKQIQRALRANEFDPGPIDGVIRDKTMRAVNAYQRRKGLPVDVDLIRFRGHLLKGGYDVHHGRNEEPTGSSAVHG
jgi:peptidoglycan hydrolase-like protein with peptidoglycan-binding domain